MTTHPELDDHRRKVVENQKECQRLGEIALASPEYAAFAAAKKAYEESAPALAHGEALERESELEEKGPGLFETCELCECPLFSDGKVHEPWTSEEGISVCAAAAREDDTLDCPGKRLGLIGESAAVSGSKVPS